MRLHRHAGVHQCKTTATHGCHRRRAIGLGNLGHDPQRILKIFIRRQAREQGALCQTAVADFAPLRCTDPARLSGRKRRHVVVKHEALAILALQCIDDLLVLLGAKRCDDQRLRFAAREQRGAVRTRQYAETNLDRPHGARIASVDAWLAVKDLTANDLRFEVEHHVAHLVAVDRWLTARCRTGCRIAEGR